MRDQVGFGFHDHTELMQGFVGLALHQIEVGCFPGEIRSGRIRGECVFQRFSLLSGVAQPLVSRRQIEPVAGGERIQGHGRAIRLRRRFRRSLDEKEIPAETMAVIGIARLPPCGALQAGEIGAVREERCAEFSPGKPQISQ